LSLFFSVYSLSCVADLATRRGIFHRLSPVLVSSSQVIGCEDCKMTYTVSGGWLNSTQSNPSLKMCSRCC